MPPYANLPGGFTNQVGPNIPVEEAADPALQPFVSAYGTLIDYDYRQGFDLGSLALGVDLRFLKDQPIHFAPALARCSVPALPARRTPAGSGRRARSAPVSCSTPVPTGVSASASTCPSLRSPLPQNDRGNRITAGLTTTPHIARLRMSAPSPRRRSSAPSFVNVSAWRPRTRAYCCSPSRRCIRAKCRERSAATCDVAPRAGRTHSSTITAPTR